jgi:hypothetical protein
MAANKIGASFSWQRDSARKLPLGRCEELKSFRLLEIGHFSKKERCHPERRKQSAKWTAFKVKGSLRLNTRSCQREVPLPP